MQYLSVKEVAKLMHNARRKLKHNYKISGVDQNED